MLSEVACGQCRIGMVPRLCPSVCYFVDLSREARSDNKLSQCMVETLDMLIQFSNIPFWATVNEMNRKCCLSLDIEETQGTPSSK